MMQFGRMMGRTNGWQNTLQAGVLLLGSIFSTPLHGQRTAEPDVGIRSNPPAVVALTNATLVTAPGKSIENGLMIIEDGRIRSIGGAIPPGAEVIDCEGDYLYPAFVDALEEFDSREYQPLVGHWNEFITPGLNMASHIDAPGDRLAELRKLGAGVVLAAPNSGIIKGRSCVLLTGDGALSRLLLPGEGFQHIRLYPSRRSSSYPNSPMGAMALVRQTLSDAKWYLSAQQAVKTQPRLPLPEANSALAALQPVVQGAQRVIIDGTNEQYLLRSDRIAREFSLDLVIRGSGQEYRRLEEVKATGRTIILPFDFPDAPEVSSPQQVADTSLQSLMHWRLAPENPSRLSSAGVDFVFTLDGIESSKELFENLQKAVAAGLDESEALRALTTGPARVLGIDHIVGSLQPGKLASFIRVDRSLFEDGVELKETWVDGQRFEWEEAPGQLDGQWQIDFADDTIQGWTLSISDGDASLTRSSDENDHAADAEATDEDADEAVEDSEGDEDADGEDDERIKISKFEGDAWRIAGFLDPAKLTSGQDASESTGVANLTAAAISKQGAIQLLGSIRRGSELNLPFVASRATDAAEDDGDSKSEQETTTEDGEEDAVDDESGTAEAPQIDVVYPLGAYGLKEQPEQPEWLMLRDATIWTSADAGVIENGDLLVHAGKVHAIGEDLELPTGALEIDASGLHLTPGIIDCHSHMATDGGVNESGQAVTAEVRIGDFIDANDITIYRQLAGGVTTSNILHGSANPIGGQNQVIKLRWGAGSEALKMKRAPGGIKFALGENVKQSNRGDEYRTRYPQSRMGVEQIMRDRFEAALLYEKRMKQWTEQPQGLPPRRDYELDAILEILDGERWIHCHSYRQDEILATIRLLDEYEVTIGSFQHILEGYKVADAMAAHGATGSSFSDWWAYKFEVYDAIPYNGAIMHRAGVVVSFNSDDRELARHLNHEAAKAVKYGGVAPEEALRFVTLNPAIQLRIDDYVGSLEVGKDADFVLWKGSPLSTMSQCVQTWVDGRKYFDRQEDQQRRLADAKLHQQLVDWIRDSKSATSGPRDDDPSYWWARFDEFCHHHEGHLHDDTSHHHDHE